jgi:3',5'-cyclic AMP phosphodiesterase CpdA
MSFTIAHITDPHLSPAPLPGLADFRLKRFMGYVNWKRARERLNDMAMLARLVEDLRAL